ncbi:ABC transporter ATP-binding protein [uncultured Friedmanniella sp.]|uniref:ABC transporter ATP-binding protein n=1 Tax=uncultured Friedmanniella sp. TaxID=335381 RepID=UPI0035C9FB85
MITFERLTRRYGSFTAVDDVSFEARPGTVTGFLGPNGAGKSTALRMLVGLTPPTTGSATILGRAFRDLPNPGRQVGVLLDASAQHGGRTGREVLTLAALVMGVDRARVDGLLTEVGLTAVESRRRVRHYSLGMRQRLGLAHALLGDPEVLVLDEPANGLDPAGIAWMRTLLRGFADRGGTVLLSSHLLREIEVVADELVLINHGRVVAAGAKTDLLAGTGTVVTSADSAALASALDRAGMAVSRTGVDTLLVGAEAARIGRVAADAGVALTSLRPADNTGLEDLFLTLTNDDLTTENAA